MSASKDEYYNKEFPKTFNDFLYLCRPFTEQEIMLAEKEALIKLCVALKKKELEYYIDRNNYIRLYDKVNNELCSLGAKNSIMKRFKISSAFVNDITNTINETFNTLDEAVIFIQEQPKEDQEGFICTDLQDGSFVHSNELLEAWASGERPEDLDFY